MGNEPGNGHTSARDEMAEDTEAGNRAKRSQVARGRHVLVTGATGFIGKVLLEALVRRHAALGIERIHLLIRPKPGLDPSQRFEQEVARARCFAALPEDWTRRVSVIPGDLQTEGCGLSPEAREQLADTVTHVIHSAASVEFDLPLPRAVDENVTTSLNLLEAARDFSQLESFVSLSTAYVTPHSSSPSPVPERLVPLPRPAEHLYREVLAGTLGENALLRETGHPNTYTLSKCIAEHLLVDRQGSIPLTLIRPSIVSATWKEPFPGWIDSHAAFAAFVMLVGSGHLRAVAARPSARVDLVPCDEVATQTLDACFARPESVKGTIIRHVVAGLERACEVELCRSVITAYFSEHPLGSGPRLHYMGPDGPTFRLREWLHHRIPMTVAATWLGLSGRTSRRQSVLSLENRLRYLNRVFPYFTHHTFDFETAAPFRSVDFSASAYLETICQGVHTLMRRGSLTRKRQSRKTAASGSSGPV